MRSKLKPLLILLTLLVGLALRFYRLEQPIADWHSHRQADTASVTRNFATLGINLFKPTYHDLSNVQSGLDNPHGYRFVEFPVYNLVSTLLHQTTKHFGFSLETTSRLVSILFSLGSSLIIFFFTRQLTNHFLPAWLSQIIFLILPYNVFYSRTVLPEPTAAFFMLLSLILFKNRPTLSSISLCLSILVKPYTAIIIFPALVLYHRHHHLKTNLLFALTTLTPFLLWRLWMKQFPEGIPVSTWLLNTQGTPFLPEWFHGINLTWINHLVAFRPHWFRWLFFDRISNLILGSYGLIALFAGLLYRHRLTQNTTKSFIIGILLYFIIIAQGNIQHDYYQVLTIPFIAILSGIGYYYLLRFTFTSPILSLASALVLFIFSVYFSWEKIKTYYIINNPNIITAGQEANRLLPPTALVIAPYVGDTAFLYQTKRSGWPTEIYDIDSLKKQHPNAPLYLVSVNYDSYTSSLINQFPAIAKNNNYVILDLNSTHDY